MSERWYLTEPTTIEDIHGEQKRLPAGEYRSTKAADSPNGATVITIQEVDTGELKAHIFEEQMERIT